MLTVTTKGSTDANSVRFIHNNRKVAYLQPVTQSGREHFGDAVQVSISGEAREFRQAQLLAQQTDAVRQERVHAIKEQLLQGSYHVDADEVARAIVRSEISRLLGR
jgi:flagellar biosynthesis anti-sigma factor FlgM